MFSDNTIAYPDGIKPLLDLGRVFPDNLKDRLKVLNLFGTIEDRLFYIYAEYYKLITRKSLINFFNSKLNDELFINLKEYDNSDLDINLRTVENDYNLKIIKKSKTSLIIILDMYQKIDLVALNMDLNKYTYEFKYLTPYNYDRLFKNLKLQPNNACILARYVQEAIEFGASDIHFSCNTKKEKPEFKILYRIGDIPFKESKLFNWNSERQKSFIYSIIDSESTSQGVDLDKYGVTAEINEPFYSNDNLSLRVSAHPVLGGYMCVVRLVPKKVASLSIEELGFPKHVQDDLNLIAKKRSGLTLITGSRRVGKNTTIMGVLNKMDKNLLKIVEYSDPPETRGDWDQINYKKDYDLLQRLIMLSKKEDLDVAYINEVPSSPVARCVYELVNSSVHVLTSIHIDRLWDLPATFYQYYGEDYKDVMSKLNAVFNQKMFTICCPHCSKSTLVSTIKDKRVRKLMEDNKISTYKHSVGCSYCDGTGFTKRVQPYVESLYFTRDLLHELYKCNRPFEMTEVLERELIETKTSLDYVLPREVEKGTIALDSLIKIL